MVLNYVVVSGSHRKNSQSSKVAAAVSAILKEKNPQSEIYQIDLAGNPLPLWDDSVWSKDPKWDSVWKPLSEKLKAADGVVIVSPEWNGTVPGGLKNFFHFCNNYDLGHKPGLIVAVSSSLGGSYPVAELRMSSYKNNRLCYIPDHVIVRNVANVFNDSQKALNPDDERIRQRLTYSLEVLRLYAEALQPVRKNSLINFKDFANGM